eukprot:GEMP01035342.1.p1 GENE.GEMP01035342.1~~GEMP01035342.1.p1  ORF type:complete len:601 (+),score=142.52 GEMP01035342.1:59-1861(+)
MCGITVVVRSSGWSTLENAPLTKLCLESLKRRGPDHLGHVEIALPEANVQVWSSVLHLRGKFTPQPITLPSSGILSWNGEIFDVQQPLHDEMATPVLHRYTLPSVVQYAPLDAKVNDAAWLATHMEPTLDRPEDQVRFLEQIRGPFAMVHVCPVTQKILCCRDMLGRRSLCLHFSKDGVVISSGAMDGGHELPVSEAWLLDLATRRVEKIARAHSHFHSSRWWAAPLCPVNPEAFCRALEAAVRRRLHSKMGILFSGGLDSTVLAALAARNTKETIDLINVAFDAKEAPDRHTALLSYEELRNAYGESAFRLILVDVEEAEVIEHEKHILSLLGPDHRKHMDFNIAAALWFAARGKGYLCRDPTTGGAEVRPKKPPKKEFVDAGCCAFCMLPGKPRCVHQACKLCCRKLRDQEFDFKDGGAIRDAPHATTCPAHKPEKVVVEKPAIAVASVRGEPYESDARVLLLGTGADELLAGYARHLTAHRLRGEEGMMSEMRVDLERLWTRNLGRDDRIISDLGREARHPFLDEGFVDLVSQLTPIVDKKMLRDVARQLQVPRAAEFEKRAIQFGSRIAQQSNRRTCGSNRQADGQGHYPSASEVM